MAFDVIPASPQRAQPGPDPSSPRRRYRGRRHLGRVPLRSVLAAMAILAVLGLGGGVWVWQRVLPVRDALTAAAELLQQISSELGAGPVTGVPRVDQLRQSTATARRISQGLDWRMASRLPFVGGDLAAVRTVAAVLDDLSGRTLPSLLALATQLDLTDLVPRDGRLGLEPWQAAAPQVVAAYNDLGQLLATMRSINTDGLAGPVGDAVGTLTTGLERLTALTGTAARSAVLVPAMLGQNGQRTYLVLFQNPTEIRATGGMPGAYVVVGVDHGALTIIDQASAAVGLGTFPASVLPLDPHQRALYGDKLGAYPANVTATPYFPTSATLAREMYRLRTGRVVDGVLATDPIALSYLLAATGPVSMPTGPALTAANAVQLLLSDTYAQQPTYANKDQYFAAAAKAVFEAMGAGSANPSGALAALSRAAGERRLLVWSARAEEEDLLGGTVLEGAMPTQDGARPQVGVFLNDGSGAKLDYYLTTAARLRVAGCRDDGRVELTLQVTLGSTAPSSGLPTYVLGLGLGGDPYTIRTNAMVFSPAGGAVLDARLEGQPVSLGTGLERGRAVAITTIYLRPGQSQTLEVRLLTATLAPRQRRSVIPSLWVTPGVNPWQLGSVMPYSC